MKNTKIKIKCVGGTNLLYLLCLISNTMPQLEQSSLQPSTYLQHRHLLQTTSYNHLLLLHLLISRKGKPKQQQARTPPPPRRGVEKPEGPSALQPTTEDRHLSSMSSLNPKYISKTFITDACHMHSTIHKWNDGVLKLFGIA